MVFWNPYSYSVFSVSEKEPKWPFWKLLPWPSKSYSHVQILGPKTTQNVHRSNSTLATRATFKNSVILKNLTIENNGLHIKFSKIIPCMLCNALHAHCLYYYPNIFLCKGVLSRNFEYVLLQHTKKSYRFQDSACDSADLILWALWSGMKLERVQLKML